MSDITGLSAVELAAEIRAKKLSPVDVAKAFLARIDRVNPALNAYVTLHAEAALCAARKAEDLMMRGGPLGPLHGVPLHVKDNLLVAGSRTTFGSKPMERNVSTEDCPAVARLRKAGMILLGRTNTPEYGWKGVTDNRVFGATKNPWNPKLTPGGSSGGASAAVAAELGPIGLGTDGGGSLRIPASFAGVFGFKPSFGRVPNTPGSGGAILRHIGTITRTVADMAAALDVIAGPDPRDLLSLPAEPAPYAPDLDKGIRGKRVAYSPNFGYANVDPEVAEICHAAAMKLKDAGATVEEVDLGWRDPYETWSVFFFGSAAAAMEKKLAADGDQLDPGFRRVVEKGLALRGVDYANALAGRHEFWEQARRVYEKFDLLLSPTLAVPPFPINQDDAPALDADVKQGRTLGPLQWVGFTYPFNLTGQPAASVPAGWTKSNLPVGLQIIGDRYADRLVLQAARAFERTQPWADRRPTLDAPT